MYLLLLTPDIKTTKTKQRHEINWNWQELCKR
jgi:hypothetical protein